MTALETRTVAIPVDVLCEAIGYVDALDTFAGNVHDDLGLSGNHGHEELPNLVTGLMRAAGVYDDLDSLPDDEYDRAYDSHPLVVKIQAHHDRVNNQLKGLLERRRRRPTRRGARIAHRESEGACGGRGACRAA